MSRQFSDNNINSSSGEEIQSETSEQWTQ